MANINWSSIMQKAEDYIEKEVKPKLEKYMLTGVTFGLKGKLPKSPEEAAMKFFEVLKWEITDHIGASYASGDISLEAANQIISSIYYDKPRKVGDRYRIDIWFEGDHHRDSLAPDTYDGVDNIIALLNKGYPSDGRSRIRPVHGVWQGHGDEEIYSLTHRSGAHFIEQAVTDFMGNYGTDYGVVDIEVSDEYTNN